MDFNDDDVPSYEESVQQGAALGTTPASKGNRQGGQPQSLTQQLSNVRSHRINSIISTYIDPLLQAQSLSGLLKTTFVLVPSNTHSLQRSQATNDSSDIIEGSGDAISNASHEAVVGFPSQDYVKMVRLHGDDYTLEFWRQPAVIKELDTSLKARLQAGGHSIAGTGAPSQQSPATPIPVESPKAKRDFFGRKSKSAEAVPLPSPSLVSEGGWRFETQDVLDPGHVRVKVGLQDVCLRVVTKMGLYETRTGKAVVVNVEIGS